MSIISSGTTTTTALVQTGNTDGTLQLQVNGTTPALTLSTAGAIGVGSSPSFGTSGQALVSAGSSAPPAWASVTTSPAGSTGQVQYNNAGAFGAISSGTSGQVLTSGGSGVAPTWTTPSSGAMTLLSTSTISSSTASVVFNSSLITSTYKTYIVQIINVVPDADITNLGMYLSIDNGSTYLSAYSFTLGTTQADSQPMIYVGSLVSGTSSYGGANATTTIYDPSSSQRTAGSSVFSNIRSTFASYTTGQYNTWSNYSTSPVNAVKIQPTSGNLVSGTIKLYGLS
jgi:hypothetical protein